MNGSYFTDSMEVVRTKIISQAFAMKKFIETKTKILLIISMFVLTMKLMIIYVLLNHKTLM